jgi:exonuclease V
MDTSWDEYDAYDLSEFSAADFVHIDNNVTTTATRLNLGLNRTTPPKEEVAGEAGRRVVGTGESGGLPQVAVALEPVADESVVVKVVGGGSGSNGSGSGGDGVDATPRGPFEEFRPRGTLSVSDLVGPAWYVVFWVIGWSWFDE